MKIKNYSIKGNASIVVPSESTFRVDTGLVINFIKELKNLESLFIVDMGNISHIDSNCINILLECKRYLRNKNIEFAICNLQKGPKIVLEITRAYEVLDVCDNYWLENNQASVQKSA